MGAHATTLPRLPLVTAVVTALVVVSAAGAPQPVPSPSPNILHPFWHAALHVPPAVADPLATTELDPALTGDPVAVARAFMRAYAAPVAAEAMGAETMQEDIDWLPRQVFADTQGQTHVRVQQTYRDVPVFAAEAIVHLDDTMRVIGVNGEYPARVLVPTVPALSPVAAFEGVFDTFNMREPRLVASQLVIFNPALLEAGTSKNSLAYHLRVEGDDGGAARQVFVDAVSGKLLVAWNDIQEGRNRLSYDLNGSQSLPGTLCYAEAGPVGAPHGDCTSLHNFSGQTYDYFFLTHNRDSFDGHGASLQGSVRYGTTANAFWNGSQTAFGPGFATKDVVAHEWTHAVTQYSADLVYANQSGALNESISDIFGAMVDREDWLMGEDTPVGAIRSLQDPTVYGDPGKVSDPQFYCGFSDGGGVHTNSGVPNHAAYLIAEGGSYNGRVIQGVGRGATERIVYRALVTYLTSGSTFLDAYNGLNSACADLFGAGSSTCTAVTLALDAVEMNTDVCPGNSEDTPDAFEPDSTSAEAVSNNRTLAVGGAAQRHNFHRQGDTDWTQVSVTAGTSYQFSTSALQFRSDTVLTLYTPAGTAIAEDDDSGDGLGSLISWTAPESGTYFLRVRHYDPQVGGTDTGYDLRATSSGSTCAADAFEIDNGPGQASPLTPDGAAQIHNIHARGDQDWARFTGTAGITYIVETADLGVGADTLLFLYASDGSTMLASDDDNGGALASRVEFTANASAPYYVMVRHFSSSAAECNTSYALRVRTGGTAPDAYEPDNTSVAARTIDTSGGIQSHNVHVASDADWLVFSATQGTGYTIETLNLGDRSDTELSLYQPNGTPIASNDDNGADLASRIVFTAAQSGQYRARVRHHNPAIHGAGTNYDVRVVRTACTGGDAWEPDNVAGEARDLTVNGEAQNHDFRCAGDRDWVRFRASIGVEYVIETFGLGTSSDTVLSLFDTHGATLLAENDDHAGPLASRLAWAAPATGTYYVQIRHFNAVAAGAATAYSLQITGGAIGTADIYEVDDDPSHATTLNLTSLAATTAPSQALATIEARPVSLVMYPQAVASKVSTLAPATSGLAGAPPGLAGAQLGHNFHGYRDRDWVRFTAAAGIQYLIETFNLQSRTDTVLALFDPTASTLLAENDDGGGGAASRIQWVAPAAGTYYIRVRPYTDAAYGTNTGYDLRVVVLGVAGDAYEVDNSPAQASLLTAGAVQPAHDFHVPGDQDWARFPATSGHSYTIETRGLGPACDTVLELYAPDGLTLLAVNDDGGGGLASRIVWEATDTGTYYARVRHFSAEASGPATNYDLALVDGAVGGDAYEPDNQVADARPLAVGSTAADHTFHIAGDQDWASFVAVAGDGYTIETLNLGVASDTYLTLYGPNGTTVLAEDDDGGPGLASRIDWVATGSGQHYVKVRHFSSSAFGPDTRYDLRVAAATCSGGDAYEPDNTAGQARSFAVNGPSQAHEFTCPGDLDWLVFPATAGIRYVIQTSGLGPRSDTVVALFASDATTLLAQNDDYGDTLASRVEFAPTGSGNLYVRISHFNASVSGSGTGYDVTVTASSAGGADPYEPDDTVGQARALAIDGSLQPDHNFHVAGDQDWTWFSTPSRQRCIVQTLDLGPLSDTVVYLYQANGTTLIASDDDSGGGLASRIDRTLDAGSYRLRTLHYSPSTFGVDTDYDIRVTCSAATTLDAFEPDESPQVDTIPIGSVNGPHTAHLGGDLDWIAFAATAGTGYVIETLNLGSDSDTVITLYGTDGATLLEQNDDFSGFASRIEWTAPSTGTYYVRTGQYDSARAGDNTRYDIRVRLATDPVGDDKRSRLVRAGSDVVFDVRLTRDDVTTIKLHLRSKPEYLQLAAVTPLTADGKAAPIGAGRGLAPQVRPSASGDLSLSWTPKGEGAADGTSGLQVRWTRRRPLGRAKLLVPYTLTLVSRNGAVTEEAGELVVPSLGTAPKINSVTPLTFPNANDTTIHLQGQNLASGAKVFLLDGAGQLALPDVAPSPDQSGTMLTVVAAGTKAGSYKLRLVSPDGQTSEFASLTIVEGATTASIHAITPTVGSTAGGSRVTILGSGFSSASTVTMGGVAATGVVVEDSGRLTATAPPHAAGVVNVTVAGAGLSATLPGAFTFVDFPVSADTDGDGIPDGSTDSDGDGIPDATELAYSFDPWNAADAAQDDDGDGRTNGEELLAGTHPRGFVTSYLAEGATSGFFDEVIALANPGPAPAQVLLQFLKSDGTIVPRLLTMRPWSRATVNPKDLSGLATAEFSTVIESDATVVVDRTMRWDTRGYGAHSERGIPSPATVWYLAEGATHSGFDLFYLIQNPNTTKAQIEVTYLRPAPQPPIVKAYTVDPHSRFNIWVDLQGPELASTDVSAVIRSTNDVPVIVERAMYLSGGGLLFDAGHESAGVSEQATSWFLAEGATGPYFDLFVLIANPNDLAADVVATFLLPNGSTVVKTYTVAANSRFNIWVDLADPRLADTAVSTIIRSTNGVGLIVERSMWWPGPTAVTWHEAHNSPGSTVTGTVWATGEGECGGPNGVETYVLLANTSGVAGSARVTLLFEDGTRAATTVPLVPDSRTNVYVNGTFPEAIGRRFGVLVESLGDEPAEIVVERAMYSNALGVIWAAGTNALATRLR